MRDRKAARRIAVILHSMGITPKSTGYSWTEVLNGLRAQYASLPAEQRREAIDAGIQLIQEKRLDVASEAIVASPSQPKPTDRPNERRGKGKSPQKCHRCWSWGFKSLWNSREAAEEFCNSENDPGLNAYACPHGNGWHVGHSRDQNQTDA
jgi:hypothetical protein